MPFVHSPETRSVAVDMVRAGYPVPRVAELLGVSWSSVYAWVRAAQPSLLPARRACSRCSSPPALPEPARDYAYLLGLYLGDGWVHRGRVPELRVYCADAWPGLVDEAARTMGAVSGRVVGRAAKQGCRELRASWNHWPCVLPQSGPGKKHERRIVLEPWQWDVVRVHPGQLLRGLFHSDGWRGTNVAVKRRGDVVTRYRYPRYEFTNKSDDIRGICCDALDLLGIAWRANGPLRIAVSRREAVAALDEHVGPKY